jgi:hypothetical protein
MFSCSGGDHLASDGERAPNPASAPLPFSAKAAAPVWRSIIGQAVTANCQLGATKRNRWTSAR